MKRGFASDNNSGVHPLIMQAIVDANKGHCIAYGDDPWTEKAVEKIKELFNTDISVYFVFNGTASNVLGISSFVRSYNAIICPESSHINMDECGATEKHTGCKLLSVSASDGKISLSQIKSQMKGTGFEHHAQPKIISISQPTELGTIYTYDELKSICDFAHRNNMYVHMDGARISNAVVSLNCDINSITHDAGIDVLSFGGTKNGMMYGEALIFFNNELAGDFKYLRKQYMQLASKMRFISAQFIAFLENDLWLQNARHANRMARILHDRIAGLKGLTISQETRSNGVFAIIPAEIIHELRKEFFFYTWDESRSEVRWMTSFDTQESDIDDFVNHLKKLLENYFINKELSP